MPKLESIKDQLKGAGDIQNIVRTMKSFAAVHIRHYRKAEQSLFRYRETVEDALGAIMRHQTPAGSLHKRKNPQKCVTGIVAMGSDQGLVGQFNDKAARVVKDMLADGNKEPSQVCVLGKRLAGKLDGYGVFVRERLAMPVSVQSIPIVLEQLLTILDQWKIEHCVEAIFMVNNRMKSTIVSEPVCRSILPPDPLWLEALSKREKKKNIVPLVTITPVELRKALVSHYLYAELFGGLIESLFSENTMRLIAMEIAEKHIADHLEALTGEFNQERQSGITEEILDIMAGVSALEKGR